MPGGRMGSHPTLDVTMTLTADGEILIHSSNIGN